MSFISLWAGDIEPYDELADHLKVLYESIGSHCLEREPQVCAEQERVPVGELVEPFSLSESFFAAACAAAKQKSLRLANTVVAVYTEDAPRLEVTEPTGCDLRFIGTYPDA